MLSYQHGYHAGNYADVIKHLTLTRLLHYMIQKDKPLLYLETHAGKGRYDLHHKQAIKTGEAQQGIGLLWAQRKKLPEVFSLYLQHIAELNTTLELRNYPGSPLIAIKTLRSQDRLFFSELHPGEFDELAQCPRLGKRVFYKNTNGLDELLAQLPPMERRGLIFIDPSYEVKTDYREIPKLLATAYHRFSTGVYCIWYPILDKKQHEQLIRGFQNIGANSHLRIEFNLTLAAQTGMTGCGLWIINPPYVLQTELKTALTTLRGLFNPGVSSFLLEGSNGANKPPFPQR